MSPTMPSMIIHADAEAAKPTQTVMLVVDEDYAAATPYHVDAFRSKMAEVGILDVDSDIAKALLENPNGVAYACVDPFAEDPSEPRMLIARDIAALDKAINQSRDDADYCRNPWMF